MVKLKVIGKFVHKIDNFLLISVISLIKVLQIHLYHSYMIMIYLAFYNIDVSWSVRDGKVQSYQE